MHRITALTVILLAVTCACGHTETLSVAMNDYSAQIVFAKTADHGPTDSMTASIRGLYNKSEDTVFGSLDVTSEGACPLIPGLNFGAGLTLYGGKAAEDAVLALALGGMVRYAPATLQGLGFRTTLRYAPNILSTLDADRLVETDYRIEYRIIPRTLLFLQYNNIRMHFTNGIKRSPEEGIMVGFVLHY